MVHKEKLPLEAVAGGELRLALVDDRQLPQQLRGGQPARRHKHRLIRRHPPSLYCSLTGILPQKISYYLGILNG